MTKFNKITSYKNPILLRVVRNSKIKTEEWQSLLLSGKTTNELKLTNCKQTHYAWMQTDGSNQ